MPADPTAAPARDWNTRIAADCYRPNAELGNYGRISWDVGPDARRLARGRRSRSRYRGFVDGDRGVHGLAQPFHHTILPLATVADRRTEIRWGLRDFEVRFGRRPIGVWLPETAVDLATLRILAEEGIDHTILAPWQLDRSSRPASPVPHRPGRRPVDGRRRLRPRALDRGLVRARRDDRCRPLRPRADRTAAVRRRPAADEDRPPFVVIATDGELYGHHQPFRDQFLARLVDHADLGFDVVPLAEVARADDPALAPATLVERTSWSCHHGVARWHEACSCVPDGSWKRAAACDPRRLAAAIDTETDVRSPRDLPGAPDPWAARDAYVDVVIGAERRARRSPSDGSAPTRRPRLGHDFLDADGGAALAPGDVRELRLVLGRRRLARRRRASSAPPSMRLGSSTVSAPARASNGASFPRW